MYRKYLDECSLGGRDGTYLEVGSAWIEVRVAFAFPLCTAAKAPNKRSTRETRR